MAKFNWHRLANLAWFYTKVFFAVLTLCVVSYLYGTHKPNESAIAKVNEELDIFYMTLNYNEQVLIIYHKLLAQY